MDEDDKIELQLIDAEKIPAFLNGEITIAKIF